MVLFSPNFKDLSYIFLDLPSLGLSSFLKDILILINY